MAQLLNYIRKVGNTPAATILANYILSLDTKDLGLYFTDEGQIHTHGLDYISSSNTLLTNLIKTTYSGDFDITNFIDDTDTTKGVVNKIFSTKGVIDLIQSKIDTALTTAIVYKGAINKQADIPAASKVGDTYKVATKGSYTVNGGTVYLEVGDTLICESVTSTNVPTWTVLQNNIDVATSKVNGASAGVYGTGTWEIFAPTSAGTENQILVSSGSGAPVWKNQATIDAGTLGGTAKADLLTALSYDNGTLSITVGGISKTASIGKVAEAGKVTNALTVTSGNGLTLKSGTTNATSYNGSKAVTLALALATTTTAGTVKIGDNISLSTDGTISLSKDNVTAALKYTPVSVASGVTSVGGVITNSATSTDEVSEGSTALANPFYNIFHTINGQKSISDSLLFVGGTGISISGTAGKVTITNTISNTWREIRVEGTSIENNKLDFYTNENVELALGTNTSGVTKIGFALRWAVIGADGSVSYETV